MAMPEHIMTAGVPEFRPEEITIWMYVLIAVGSAFVVFLLISLYLMWRTKIETRRVVEREALCEAEVKPHRRSNSTHSCDSISSP